jgi:DNA-binding transcriptional MerR regulator
MTGPPVKKSYLRAGELAKAAGVSSDTLHHYERKGVLAAPRRSSNGYREYPIGALDRVRLVRQALAVGFTLDELALILKARDEGNAPCREVRSLAATKLSDVEVRLRELISLRDILRVTLKDWDTRLAKTAAGHRAGLLESLAASGLAGTKHNYGPSATWRRKKRKVDDNEKH